MINKTKKYFFSRLLEDTLGYFSVYDFLKLKFKQALNRSSIFNNSKEFWDSILKDELISDGQIVKIKNFYLSDYFPKLPGKLWTPESKREIIEGNNEIIATTTDGQVNVLSLEGKRKIINAGYGSVRLRPQTNGIYCTVLSAVSPDNWFADAGIPIVVSKSVYDEFIKKNIQGAPWIEELEGILYLNRDISLFNNIPKAIGSSLSTETIDLLTNSPNLPKTFIYVPSPLNIKLRTNNTFPNVVAWTTFKTSNKNEPLRFTYSTFNPNEKGSLEYSIEFINNYVRDFGGTTILTDFDGKIRRLNSKVDLGMGIKIKETPVFNNMLKTIDDWLDKHYIN